MRNTDRFDLVSLSHLQLQTLVSDPLYLNSAILIAVFCAE